MIFSESYGALSICFAVLNEASSINSMASAPSSIRILRADVANSILSKITKPVDLAGGSSIVLSSMLDTNANVPSDPIIK